MTDREILEKHINVADSCLTESEKTQVRDMIYEYREAFSIRDEIGTCPNIEVDIDITDKTPFFIRPYHVKEEDKRILGNEEVMLLGNMEIRLFSLLKPGTIDQ